MQAGHGPAVLAAVGFDMVARGKELMPLLLQNFQNTNERLRWQIAKSYMLGRQKDHVVYIAPIDLNFVYFQR